MSKKFLIFNDMNDFYSLEEVCDLFAMDKETVFQKMEEANLRATRNSDGALCLSKDTLCRLNKKVYWTDGPERKKKNHFPKEHIFSPDGAQYILINDNLCFWNFSMYEGTIHLGPRE